MLKQGQVLVLKIRYNNNGECSKTVHPYIVIYVDENEKNVEIAQFDSLKGKEYKAAFKSNFVVYCDDPTETVIDCDSFVQLDNEFKVELCHELEMFRRQEDVLSEQKLNKLLARYLEYHRDCKISNLKKVYMDKEELMLLNAF